MPARAIRIVAIMGIALLAASVAKAAEPASAGHAGLDDAEIEQRIRFLEQRLDDSRTHGQIWYWSWLAINGGSMVGNGIVAGLSGQHDDRVNYATGAALGAIGVADLFLRPLEARYGAAPIRRLPERPGLRGLRSCAPPRTSCTATRCAPRSAPRSCPTPATPGSRLRPAWSWASGESGARASRPASRPWSAARSTS
jgi:hypothetical protein